MSSNWNTPPGDTQSARRLARKLLISLLVGMLSIGVAWAGTGLVPVSDTQDGSGAQQADDNWLQDVQGDEAEAAAAEAGQLPALAPNQVYAGAAKVSITPDPVAYNGTWERDRAKCETFTAPQNTDPESVTDFRVRWAEKTDCIYTGGYDLGPANAVSTADEEFGLWARAVSLSDGDDSVVLLELDGTYYFAKYGSMCNDDPAFPSKFDGEGPGANQYTQDCGFRDLQNSMAEHFGYQAATEGDLPQEVDDNVPGEIKDPLREQTGVPAEATEGKAGDFGITPASFFLASSHAHAAPDFVGAWGGVPRWYMQQVEDAIREAVYSAVSSMTPAFIESGEVLYRGGNNMRRGHYRAAEEAGETWTRFIATQQGPDVCTTTTPPPPPSPSPTKGKPKPAPTSTSSPTPIVDCKPGPDQHSVIATVGTYAAHPVDHSDGRLYADLAAVFAKRAEERFGGMGIFFQTGFGNVSSRGSRRTLGQTLVDLIPPVGTGQRVTGAAADNPETPRDDRIPNIQVVQRFFDQPVTNSVLAAGGISGVFDRPMESRPSQVSIGKDSLGLDASRMPHKRCTSASPVTVNSSVSAAKIGNSLILTGGPGELFSGLTTALKENNPDAITLPLSLVNDGLGYIMQSIETDHGGRQGVGFVNGPLSEYEDAYSIDHCFGDHVLEQTIAGLNSL